MCEHTENGVVMELWVVTGGGNEARTCKPQRVIDLLPRDVEEGFQRVKAFSLP